MVKKYVSKTLDKIEIITVKYKYYICDVFTTKRFGGNLLAVLSDAEGLTAKQMQQIGKEFNFSESAFIFPPENGNIRKRPSLSIKKRQFLEKRNHSFFLEWKNERQQTGNNSSETMANSMEPAKSTF